MSKPYSCRHENAPLGAPHSSAASPATRWCDENCNECPLVRHPNSRLLTVVVNALAKRFGADDVCDTVNKLCPNLTVCYDCRIDDLVHCEGCDLCAKDDECDDLRPTAPSPGPASGSEGSPLPSAPAKVAGASCSESASPLPGPVPTPRPLNLEFDHDPSNVVMIRRRGGHWCGALEPDLASLLQHTANVHQAALDVLAELDHLGEVCRATKEALRTTLWVAISATEQDLCPCLECGRPTICLPDGQPICARCATK